MTLLDWFALRYRLRVRRDECFRKHIRGRRGEIYQDDMKRLRVMLLDLTPKMWGHRRNACLRTGMELIQDGDGEGSLSFDPRDPVQARAAIKAAHVKRRRQPSGKQLEVLKRARERAQALRQSHYAAEDAREAPTQGIA